MDSLVYFIREWATYKLINLALFIAPKDLEYFFARAICKEMLEMTGGNSNDQNRGIR